MPRLFTLLQSDLDRLGSAGGRNATREALQKLEPVTHSIMKMVFDPYHNFGLRKLPKRDSLDDLLSDLAGQEQIEDQRIIEALQASDRKWLRNNAPNFDELQHSLVSRIIGDWNSFNLGFSGGTYLEYYPGSFEYFALTLAATPDPEFELWPRTVGQPKFDGVRCVIIVNYDGSIKCLSRNGKPVYNIASSILDTFSKFPGFVFDGEAVTNNDFELSVGIVHRSKNSTESSGFVCFDVIPLEDFRARSCNIIYEHRLTWLRDNLPGSLIAEAEPVENHEQVRALYAKYRQSKFEGLIIKDLDGMYGFDRYWNVYEAGNPKPVQKGVFAWMKFKPLVEDTFQIIGYKPGRGRNKDRIGAIQVKVEANRQFKSADGEITTVQTEGTAWVGSGLTDKVRDYLWEIRDQLHTFKCEVEFMEATKKGSLRHPRFIKLRDDI